MSVAATISEALEARHREVLQHLLPGGRFVGNEFRAGSLAGEKGESLRVALNGGKRFVWSDFASDDKGADLLDLWAKARTGGDLSAAMREAADFVGLKPQEYSSTRFRRSDLRRAQIAADKLPDGQRSDLGEPSARYVYADQSGDGLLAVFRYDKRDGKKEFFPYDLRGQKWFSDKAGHPLPKPRPLFNLFELRSNGGPVLFLEGEKCAVAAGELGILATTMLGGTNGIGAADFSPLEGRTVYLWPDNDEPGRACMEKVGALLQDLGATIYEVRIPDGKAVGWDLADAVAEGMTAEEILSLINSARLVNPPPLDVFGDATLAGTPDLPDGCLPPAIDLFARDESRRIGNDPGVQALACLVVTAGAIHDRYRLQPKQHDHRWKESARLWGAAIDETGARKTPTIKAAISPVQHFEIDKHAENERILERFRLDEKIYNKALESYAAKRAKGEPCEEPRKPERPRNWRRLVDDATLESLSEIAVDNPGGLLCVVDELSGWFGSFDAYRANGAGRDRALWLELYNGGPKLYDRVKRGRVLVPNWSACLFGGIQPGPMRRLAGRITDDGLVQRFIVVFGKGATEGEDTEPDRHAVLAYREMIMELLRLEPAEEVVFTLSPEAQQERALVAGVARNVSVLQDTSPAFRSHLAKWEGLFARLTLTFHMAEATAIGRTPAAVVSGDTAARVARFMCDYLLPNAARFYVEILGRDQLEHPRWIAGHILSHRLDRITAHGIGRVYRELRDNLSAIQSAMMTLTVAGWVTAIDKGNGKPPSRWAVDPRVHEIFAARAADEKRRREEVMHRIRAATEALGLRDDQGEEDACSTIA